ncbi:MAG: Crp/Fnr family transcriptional regulator [Planctomycetales bacterium]|nr:Crp/Fnr family transcriptional regulator [Planctomycetales bacterium]
MSSEFSFFHNCPEPMRSEMQANARRAHLTAGSYFYCEDGTCESVAWVVSGRMRVFKRGATGREITLYSVREGETCLVNMLCAVLDRKSPASAQAETDVEAMLVPANVFRKWVRSDTGLLDYVLEVMSQRVIDLMTLVEEIAFRRMDERLSSLLHERFAHVESMNKKISATHEEIAADLGTAREVVSRLLKELERRGAIELGRGKIALLDPTALFPS